MPRYDLTVTLCVDAHDMQHAYRLVKQRVDSLAAFKAGIEYIDAEASLHLPNGDGYDPRPNEWVAGGPNSVLPRVEDIPASPSAEREKEPRK